MAARTNIALKPRETPRPIPHPNWRLDPAHVHAPTPVREGWYQPVKRAGDFLLTLGMLVAAAPLLLVLAALVKLTSRGPAFYSQVRVGKGGRSFTMYKLRTMTHDCERHSGPCWAGRRDSRVTRLGRLLRRTHLDELPQLWNVLRGDMSLIGPRPERPEFIPALEEAIPRYRDRLQVLPGLTGLAQILLPADTGLDDVRRKLAYDLHYLRRTSLWLDCRILACTVIHVLGVPCYRLCHWLLMPGPKPEHAKPLVEAATPSFGPRLNWLPEQTAG